MIIMSVDYGDVRTGIAICDKMQILASPVCVITEKDRERLAEKVKEIAIEKCGFFLPECAYYDYINDSPDDANKATIVKKAMEAIEDENPKMSGVLPKEVYAQLVPEEEPELLSNIVRIFNNICPVRTLKFTRKSRTTKGYKKQLLMVSALWRSAS